MHTIPMHQMSGQKYRRTNFEEDEDGDIVVPQCVSPMEEMNGGIATPSGSIDNTISFRDAANAYHRRTFREKCLIAAVVILSIIAVILAMLLATRSPSFVNTNVDDPATSGMCTSKVCVTLASTILNAIDETVDPCEDFYNFACGGWMKAHPIPAGEARWDAFGVLKQSNQVVLKHLLESNETDCGRSEAEFKAKQYYQSCMDPFKAIEILGAEPLLDLLKEFGGWSLGPVKGIVWSPVGWDFQKDLEKIHSIGLPNFFSNWVDPDEKNPTVNVLQFDQGGLVLQREQYLNRTIQDDPLLSAYLNFMVGLAELLGSTDHNETVRQLTEVIEIEQAIANITVPHEDRRDDEKMYHKMTLNDLQQRSSFIDWVKYVNALLHVSNYTVDKNEEILVYEPEYMTQVSDLVTGLLAQPDGPRKVHNYIVWHLVKMMSQFLSKPFRDVRKEFLKIITGVSGEEEKWRSCVADTDGMMGMALGSCYVRETFQGESKQSAEEMVQNIKDAFIKNLDNISWMNTFTRNAAADKARSVVDMIGFPEYILNATRLDKKYKNLEINESEYFMNNYRAILFNHMKNFDKLRKPPDNTTWSMTPPTVNAYYQPTKNQIVFPAGILQRPFYDKNYPRSLNYGAMGVVMGHELTHGFDDQGREYDKYGYLRPWWNETVIQKFTNQTECMMKQYSSYTSFGEHLKGKQTLGENIADNGGLKAAYLAYENWVKVNNKGKEETRLPGLNYSHKQLFFLAFSQVWCSNSRQQDVHNAILSDSHSMPRFRVIGSLSNSVEFSDQFDCPIGSHMNPHDKCVVW